MVDRTKLNQYFAELEEQFKIGAISFDELIAKMDAYLETEAPDLLSHIKNHHDRDAHEAVFQEALQEDLFQEALRQPVRQRLADCLMSCRKDQLMYLACLYQDVVIAKYWRKDRIVSALMPHILERFRQRLLYGQLHLIKLMEHVMEWGTRYGDSESLEDLIHWRDMGFLFVFRNKQQHRIDMVIPEDFYELLDDFSADKKQLAFAKESMEYLNYLLALANLYGVFRKKRIKEVWQAHHGTEFDEYRLAKIIDNNEDSLPVVQKKSWYQHVLTMTDSEATVLWTKQAQQAFYMPTKADIAVYSEHLFDVHSPYFIKFFEFLSRRFAEYEVHDIVDVISHELVWGATATDVLEGVRFRNGQGLFDHQPHERKQFIELYSAWYNHFRMWINNGFTPAELSAPKQQKNTTVLPFPNHNNVIQFPKRNKT